MEGTDYKNKQRYERLALSKYLLSSSFILWPFCFSSRKTCSTIRTSQRWSSLSVPHFQLYLPTISPSFICLSRIIFYRNTTCHLPPTSSTSLLLPIIPSTSLHSICPNPWSRGPPCLLPRSFASRRPSFRHRPNISSTARGGPSGWMTGVLSLLLPRAPPTRPRGTLAGDRDPLVPRIRICLPLGLCSRKNPLGEERLSNTHRTPRCRDQSKSFDGWAWWIIIG